MNQTSHLLLSCQDYPLINGIYNQTSHYHWKSMNSDNLLTFDSQLFRWIIQTTHDLCIRSQITTYQVILLPQLSWYMGNQLIHISCKIQTITPDTIQSKSFTMTHLKCQTCHLFHCHCPQSMSQQDNTQTITQTKPFVVPKKTEKNCSSPSSVSLLQEKHNATLWKTGGLYLLGKTLQQVNETTQEIATKLKNRPASNSTGNNNVNNITGINTTEDQVVILNFATFSRTSDGNALAITNNIDNKHLVITQDEIYKAEKDDA